jgi:hypothetical protein
METTSFATNVTRFFGNQARNSRKGGKIMKVLKGLMTVAAALGITTSAYADGGWLTIYANQIKGVGVVNSDYSVLKTTVPLEKLAGGGVFTTKECQGWNGFYFAANSPAHDRLFALLTTAFVTGQNIEVWVGCSNTTDKPYHPFAASVNIFDFNR